MKDLRGFYGSKNILITGGCGSIGRQIVNELLKFDVNLVKVFDNSEYHLFEMERNLREHKNIRLTLGDVRDVSTLELSMKNIDIVFHTAALKHVPSCEYNPFETVRTNILGTQNVIDAARSMNVNYVINISTDKAINPVNIMGASKLIAERLVLSSSLMDFDTKYSCVRFGNVLDSDGSVIPIFRSQIKKGGPVTVTHKDMTRFFMSLYSAVNLVLKAASITKGREVFILKMNSFRITDLAEVMIEELAPKYGYSKNEIKIEYIGLRPGEKLSESLLTKEELPFTEEKEDMYVLRPRIYAPHLLEKGESKIKLESELNSDKVRLLKKGEIRKELYKYNIL